MTLSGERRVARSDHLPTKSCSNSQTDIPRLSNHSNISHKVQALSFLRGFANNNMCGSLFNGVVVPIFPVQFYKQHNHSTYHLSISHQQMKRMMGCHLVEKMLV